MLEVCPTSNLLTGALADADAVRDVFRTFLDAGVRVTVSTDGPEMMRTHLRDEFAFLCVDRRHERRRGARRQRARARGELRGPIAVAGIVRAVPDELQRTPLYARHAESGGRLVPFAGWEMPVQYAGVIDEVHAVRTAAGVFDVSHMGQLQVGGRRRPRVPAGRALERPRSPRRPARRSTRCSPTSAAASSTTSSPTGARAATCSSSTPATVTSTWHT